MSKLVLPASRSGLALPPRLAATVGATAPYLLWLIGVAVMTVVATESLLGDAPPDVAAIGAFATYATSATVALLLLGFMFLFAFSCSLMLSWLQEAVRPALVAQAVSLAFWAITANAWIGAVLVVVDPPASLAWDAILLPSGEEEAEDILGMPWLNELRYIASVAFVVVCFVALSRHVKRLHALLAVLFGSATVAFVTSAIGWLGDTGL